MMFVLRYLCEFVCYINNENYQIQAGLAIGPASAPLCPSWTAPLEMPRPAIRCRSQDRSKECRTQPCCCRVPCTCTESRQTPNSHRSRAQNLREPKPAADFRPMPPRPTTCRALANPCECRLRPGTRFLKSLA